VNESLPERPAAGRHVLVVDDDPGVRKVIEDCLKAAGFRVTALPDAQRVTEVLQRGDVAVAVLDLTLPGEDGLTITRRLREHYDIGILIVSGRSEMTDRVIGLEIGADDYLPKPFATRELVARVRSVMRRFDARSPAGDQTQRTRLGFLGFEVDLGAMSLSDPQGRAVSLTTGEFRLLEALVTHANRVLTRDQLLELLYDRDTPAFDRSVDVKVGRLRRKLGDDPDNPRMIRTVRNGGYVFVAQVSAL
jgi:two-component system, OmpR family, response regulator